MIRPRSSGRFRVDIEERALRPSTEPNGNMGPGIFPGTVGEDVDTPGDAMGFEIVDDPAGPMRSFATMFTPSPWSGYPATWQTPLWNGLDRLPVLVDTAWAAIDKNSKALATMPAYRVDANGDVMSPTDWMINPDPDLYSSWHEFAKQLFWDYQQGEAFVLPTAYMDGLPARFHVVSPWMLNVDMDAGRRRYKIGTIDVTDEILHLRYKSTTDDARGHGALEAGQSRVVAAGVLSQYATELARGGGVPYYALTHPDQLTQTQTNLLLEQWWESRTGNLGLPAVLSGGVGIETMQMSPKDMALLDLAQFNESRIAVMLGVPPFLLGLPSGGDSMTYSNVTSLFEYHWRDGLRPLTRFVMSALSGWALPAGESIELNSDEYVRPGFGERATAWATLHGIEDVATGRVIDAAEIRTAERLNGVRASATLNGGI